MSRLKLMHLRLTREQKRAAATQSDRIYIVAAPGAGKTTVAAERYGVLRYQGGHDARAVLALSFARSARGELEERIRHRWGSDALRWPHQAVTLDSLHCSVVVHLLRTGAIRWPGDHKELTVLDSWRGQPGARPLDADYRYCRIARLAGRRVVTDSRRLGRAMIGYGNKAPHDQMLAAGICTHDEIRQVLWDAVREPALQEQIAAYLSYIAKAVIVDEVFDGNRLDLALVQAGVRTGLPSTLIGDPWQALYEFRGAEPELVPAFVQQHGFETLSVTRSFRFNNEALQSLAGDLRAGRPMVIQGGSAAEADVVLASEWRNLWTVSDNVLPLAFGQINNRTDAALALLLEPLAVAHFGVLARAAPEAALSLNLTPDVVRTEVPDALIPVLDRISGGSEGDAAAGLRLLRRIVRELGGRTIPALAARQEAGRVANLVALSRRLGRDRLIPGLTVHQAKGREWTSVAVHLTPPQLGRLATGLSEERAGDRAIYVALTRARDRVFAV